MCTNIFKSKRYNIPHKGYLEIEVTNKTKDFTVNNKEENTPKILKMYKWFQKEIVVAKLLTKEDKKY